MRRDILVSYDVSTLELKGRKRLARVGKVCKNYGQRVQYSVFECTVNEMEYEKLKRKLLSIIEPDEDSLRIYHLTGRREQYLESFGVDKYIDFDEEPLIV